MERKQKIELLKGITKGTIPLKSLMIKQDPFVVDEDDNRDIITAIKSNNTVILSKDFKKFEASGLIKGFVIDLRNRQTKLLKFN